MGRAWVMVAIASCCSLLVVGIVAVVVFGFGFMMALAADLSR
ncbi:hypothetical protein [Streptomyces carpinensis]|uniref:Integral membrane protein n=1 Tax=Streptomyces carpinensis TaxID=66369 RepID=A0ABV1VWS4_9ACTN|nr:hypothetical protein [Streptomyces carpinensis]